MKDDTIVSQEDLNNELKKREREEYYEDKLLELKMQRFLDNYLIENELSKYKNDLLDLNKKKESLLKENENLSNKISEIKEAKKNYENTIKDLDIKIKEAEETKKNIESEIKSQQEFLQEMGNEDNLVNYIIKNFSDEFKKEIYEICSKKVNDALKNNNSGKKNNIKEDKKSNYRGGQKDSKFTMVTEQSGEFISYSQEAHSKQTTAPSSKKANMPFPSYPYNNNQFMMYPMLFPYGQNMQGMKMQGYPNPYYFVPVQMNPNNQSNKESHNEEKNK
jgi:chromosome segregation ATPase